MISWATETGTDIGSEAGGDLTDLFVFGVAAQQGVAVDDHEHLLGSAGVVAPAVGGGAGHLDEGVGRQLIDGVVAPLLLGGRASALQERLEAGVELGAILRGDLERAGHRPVRTAPVPEEPLLADRRLVASGSRSAAALTRPQASRNPARLVLPASSTSRSWADGFAAAASAITDACFSESFPSRNAYSTAGWSFTFLDAASTSLA